jgi:hypothetical protein
MNRFDALRKLNPLLFLVAGLQAATGVVFVFSPASFMGAGGWGYYVHRFNGLVLVVLIVAHAALNWGWVKANIFKI